MSIFSGVAVIFGAGSSNGSAVARLLVQRGCLKLVLADYDEDNLSAVIADCQAFRVPGLLILSRKCDLQVPADIEHTIESAVEKFGQINYCANCHEIHGFEGRTAEIALSDFAATNENWQRGVWLALRSEVRQLLLQRNNNDKGEASIVNVSAAQGLASDRGFPSYCAAAHGIVGMSRATAMDYLKHGIRINCVCPGPTKSPVENSETKKNYRNEFLPRVPLGRDISSDEIAQAVVFLLGEGASAITGIELPVDGGWSLYHH